MKGFVRLRLVLAVAALCSSAAMMAVTLPSTSYTPYSSDETSYYGVEGSFVTLSGSSFQSLGASVWCTDETPGTSACEDCCYDAVIACYSSCSGDDCSECDTNNKSCRGYCNGASLPLDGGLGLLLALSALGAVLKPLLWRKR